MYLYNFNIILLMSIDIADIDAIARNQKIREKYMYIKLNLFYCNENDRKILYKTINIFLNICQEHV